MTPKQLRDLRRSLGLSQRQLGLAVYLGGKDPARHIRKLEAGDVPITGPMKKALESLRPAKQNQQ